MQSLCSKDSYDLSARELLCSPMQSTSLPPESACLGHLNPERHCHKKQCLPHSTTCVSCGAQEMELRCRKDCGKLKPQAHKLYL
jgi:hypothetical protein